MADFFYTKARKAWDLGQINWEGGTIKAILAVTGYTPSRDVHEWVTDFSEYIGGGYSRQTLTGAVVNLGTGKVTGDGPDVTFSALPPVLVKGLAIILDTGTPSSSRLLVWIDSGFPLTPTTGQNLVVQWNALGIWDDA